MLVGVAACERVNPLAQVELLRDNARLHSRSTVRQDPAAPDDLLLQLHRLIRVTPFHGVEVGHAARRTINDKNVVKIARRN